MLLPNKVTLTEISQTKEKYCMTPLVCQIQNEMIQMNFIYKTERDSDLDDKLIVAGVKG